MKHAGEEQDLHVSLQGGTCPHVGGLTVKYHSDTRQAPDAKKPKASTGGGCNLGCVKSQYDPPRQCRYSV